MYVDFVSVFGHERYQKIWSREWNILGASPTIISVRRAMVMPHMFTTCVSMCCPPVLVAHLPRGALSFTSCESAISRPSAIFHGDDVRAIIICTIHILTPLGFQAYWQIIDRSVANASVVASRGVAALYLSTPGAGKSMGRCVFISSIDRANR